MSYRDKLLHGLFTTAIEGGINYWAEVDRYHWDSTPDDKTSTDDLHGFYAQIIESEEGVVHRVDRAVMSKGYALAVGGHRDKIAWSTEPPPLVVTEQSYDDWDYDAGDADCILQLGLFGDVKYG